MRLLAPLLSCVLYCALAAAQTASSALVVEVIDPSGRPLSAAVVSLRASAAAWSREIAATPSGSVSVEPPLRGSYVLEARAPGFSSVSRTIAWPGESPVRLTLPIAGLPQQLTVTSASRVEELQDDTPMKVDVVTREAMASTGYERLTDVLAEIPGIVTRNGASAAVGTQQVRGVSARQVAVLQDGLPLVGARGIKSGNLNLNRQSVGRLDRVEVVKGAASSLFGSDAIGGVINLISREPSQPLQGNLNLSGGSLGIFDGRGDIGTRYKNLTLFLDLEQHRQDAYSLIPNSVTTVGPEFRRNDLFFKTRYAFSPRFTLGFSANAYHNREEGRNIGETGPTLGLSNDSQQNYAVVADLIPSATTTVQFRAYSARYDENSRNESLTAPRPPALANLNQRYRRLDGTISHQLGSRHFLQGGYEWVQDHYRGANRLVGDNAGQQITANDLWLQDRIRLTSRASLDIGGRFTAHSLFGSYAVPKAGLVFRLTDRWNARASYGRGFRAPDLGQLYFRFANPASFYQVIGNPGLQPETSQSYSAGADYRIRRFRASLALFRNDIRNLIDAVNIGTPRTPDQLAALLSQYGIPSNFDPLLNRQTFLYRNFSNIYTQGFEADAETAIGRDFRVLVSYAFLDARDKLTGRGLPQRHKHQGFARFDYNNRPLGIYANVRGTLFGDWWLNPAAGTRGSGYNVWDFYLAKDLPRGLQAYGAIDNFADSRDTKLANPTPTFDRPDPGRLFRIGLRWRFGGVE